MAGVVYLYTEGEDTTYGSISTAFGLSQFLQHEVQAMLLLLSLRVNDIFKRCKGGKNSPQALRWRQACPEFLSSVDVMPVAVLLGNI